MTNRRIETDSRPKMHSRLEIHNANVVDDVARAGGCGLENLRDGLVCGRSERHNGPCDFMPLATVRTTEGLAQTGAIAPRASKP